MFRPRNLIAVARRIKLQKRWIHKEPKNTVLVVVPQQEAYVVERFGKFSKILDPGLNFILPVVDKIKYVQCLKEIAINIPSQSAVTADNVTLKLDTTLYVKVIDPYKASYGVEDVEFAVTQLAQTTMRAEICQLPLDLVITDRDQLNAKIIDTINEAAKDWGVRAMRYEIREMEIPERVLSAMQRLVEAEREKRATILQSEGIRESEINVAEGKKQARILASEAVLMESLNEARGEADATVTKAEARVTAIDLVAQALRSKDGKNAVTISVAEQYLDTFNKLASGSVNNQHLPAASAEVLTSVSEAMDVCSGKSTAYYAKPTRQLAEDIMMETLKPKPSRKLKKRKVD